MYENLKLLECVQICPKKVSFQTVKKTVHLYIYAVDG